jgi:protoporphyrinogen/coproporphyrinogen III oxidase
MSTDVDVLVLGAGISGLATAFQLKRRGATVEMLEAATRAGGVIGTRHRNGALVERGPNSTLDSSPLINELLDGLGIRGERLDASADAATRFIVRDGELVALPTSPGTFLTTSAFSFAAKRKLFGEIFVPPAPAGVEESIADFVRRRLGAEFLDYAIDPFVSGVYAGDPERISVSAAFPRLYALEQKYGSLIKGQIMGARERKKSAEKAKNTAGSFSFLGGMQALTDALAASVGRIETGVNVRRIEQGRDNVWTVAGARGSEPVVRRARAVVLAVPAAEAAKLTRELWPPAAKGLSAIEYAAVASAATAYRRADIRHPLAGFGFLVPKAEYRRVLGTLFSSSMFPNRAPENIVLLTTYIGGMRNPELPSQPDGTLGTLVHEELSDLVGATNPPVWIDVNRTTSAIPQYNLGHAERLRPLEDAERARAGLYFCGSYRGGVSVGDCIKSATVTADFATHFLAGVRPA